jgi:DNA-binding sugar fermentation-stimulating protein
VARDERHFEQLFEREQAGAQAVVYVVIVVSDVVRDRRDLRLQARP